ncbi:MAG: TatD family hydrolase [Candidatus Verstraetearchaeota archaeon]|nr:TatD family hydrolase [Candidatus Culexarchaeum yellowstonense]NHV11926.1 TatD family hydrolase [Candidatus Verstraetearchaeota archaeon]
MRFVDVHCHIMDECFDNDREEVLMRAKKSNVIAIISCAFSKDEAMKTIKLMNSHKYFLFLTCGWDPTNFDINTLTEYQSFIVNNLDVVIGIGEVGLDYYYIRDSSLRNKQKEIFISWIAFAKKVNLPIIVHSRNAGDDAIELLISENVKRVILHAFDGKISWAKKAVENGFFFSIPPSIVRSSQKQQLVKNIPLESIMLESDAPVLSPYANQRNEPANLIYSAKMISELKNINIELVSEVTTQNALSFFNILF